MRYLLIIAFCALMSGCVTLPEPTSVLNDYDFQVEPIGAALELPEFEVTAKGPAMCVVDPLDQIRFEQFIIAADANTRALIQATDAYYSKAEEARYLLLAGKQAEIQARIYYEAANSHSAAMQALMWPATGLGGLMLLLIAL